MGSKLLVTAAALLLCASAPGFSQQEGPARTSAILLTEARSRASLTPKDLSVEVDGHASQITDLVPIAPNGIQVALLIDDGLRTSVSRQIPDIRRFIQNLPAGAEIFVGYLQNGRVVAAQSFTTDHASAAASLRIPLGSAGISASPYFCLSDFAKKWPTEPQAYGVSSGPAPHKARFVLMLTNGVDPYNGSVSPMNQDSPYVQAAITDAQRAGISVSSIYYGDAGIRGGAANFSGQSYLAQVAEATGGISFYQGTGNPVSLEPFFNDFQKDIAQSYVADFTAPAGKDLVRVKFRTHVAGVKLHAPALVHPGRSIAPAA